MKNLQSGDVAQRDKGENDRAGCDGACDDRSQALFHPSQDQTAATPRILLFEILEAPDLDDPVAQSKAENREKSQERAEREHSAAERGRDEASKRRHRRAKDEESGQPPASQSGVQQQNDRHDGRN